MDTREAVKVTLKHLFECLEESGRIDFSQGRIENAIQLMHEDDTFFEELIDFMQEHIEAFGDNYGLK